MKILKKLFSRSAIVIFFILVQLAISVYIAAVLSQNYFYIRVAFTVLGIAAIIAVVNRDMSASYKVPWLVLLFIFPIAGVILYALLGNPRLTKKMHRRQKQIADATKEYCVQDQAALAELERENSLAAGQAKYLWASAGAPLYNDTDTQYFSSGEDAFVALKQKLNAAKKFIFLEYFIIEKGKMWSEILEILQNKASQGVEVKIIYDDLGCAGVLGRNYCSFLAQKGIECVRFNRLTFMVTAMHNNRDHRKITVVDGEVAFVGGFNIADEYINLKDRLGYWKDSAVMLSGCAAQSLTLMFLRQYMGVGRDLNVSEYIGEHISDGASKRQGYVLPFGDGPAPSDPSYIGEEAYLNIINQAKRYLYITTPYLIVDYHVTKALIMAAKRGVDVRIITPGVPDKKLVFVMTKSSYAKLIRGGVKIYEFTPGFIHAKNFLCDDEIAVIGSINLDYRSLVHHFECGVWMYKTEAVTQMREDFDNTIYNCTQIQGDKTLKWHQKIFATVFRIFAPLM
ncbi:MAG: cardiolipin synthase [Clostridia bacterium]|nr:cardiolipin synthase [Clostridia bacterium]